MSGKEVDVRMAAGVTVSVPMVSVRVMPVRVLELLRETEIALDQCALGAPGDILDLRHAVQQAKKDAARIVEREDRTELARRRYVEAAIR